MTGLLEKTGRRQSSRGADLGGPRLPQVDLLPPEVRASRGLSQTKRWLGLSLILVVLVAALAYGWAFLTEKNANEHLAESQDTAAELSREKVKYAEVPVVLGAISDVKVARLLGMSTEVAWTPHIQAIAAVLPAGTSIESFTITQASPTETISVPGDQLNGPRIASIVFTARSATLPDGSAWLDALDSIPGFVDPTLQSTSLSEADGVPFYMMSSTIEVDASALADRFIEVKE